jgi:NADPH-dependent 2,4-dienoyl-CoA reductase/sulfur reductase-like enzyme
MMIIRAEFAPDFRGDDVVLLAMDGAGVAGFAAALKDAQRQGSSQLLLGGVTHEFVIAADEADIDLDDIRVVWRLDPAKAVEIIEDLDELSSGDRPGHHYVDISNPTDTLVLSRDEYVRPS